MLAILAALVLSPARVLPEPFLSPELEPILPVEHLRDIPRFSVARGGSWRPNGLVRLTYYYRFPKGRGPTHKDFLSEPGFMEEPSRFGNNPSVRAARILDGIRQTVSVSELEPGVNWRWAKLTGPATVVAVTEFPLIETLPRWHNIPSLNEPHLPPGFPPDLRFLKNTKVVAIDCDPIIPRFYRTAVSMMIKLTSIELASNLLELAKQDFGPEEWKPNKITGGRRFARKVPSFGLQSAEIYRSQTPSPNRLTEITLTYSFADPENAPRIEE